MSKLLHSRVFRFLVCFLVVCCILVNLSPLKVQATVVVGTALTLEGILALLFSMAIGVVAVDLTAETINRIGTDLEETIITEVDTSELQKWNNLKNYWESIDPDGPEDPGEWHDMLKKALSGGLLVAIAGWLCTLVNMDGYEVDYDTASDGYMYYGYLLLPSLDLEDDRDYIIKFSSSSPYTMYRSSPGYSISSKSSGELNCVSYVNSNVSGKFGDVDWSGWGGLYNLVGNVSDVIWSYHDILYPDGSIAFKGSEPKSTYTEIIEPSIYVGDIPQQIKDGEKDENNLNLPVLDPYKLIQSPDTALNDLNQMQQALKDGTITLDDYLKQVQVQDPTDNEDPSNPTQAPSESTTPTTPVDPWEPPENPGQFALDLREVFPFCIPFDLYNFLSLLNADPVAPVINWEIALPGGGSYPLRVDLSPFDSVAQLLRRLQLLLFIVALGIKTRDLIKG